MKSFLPSFFKDLTTCTSFSEPGCGKEAMDRVGGAIKRNADFAVKHGADITCSADLVEKLSSKSKTWLIEIPPMEIESARRAMPTFIPPVKRIMSLRQVSYGKKGMFGRNLSCFQCLFYAKCKHYGLMTIEMKGAARESSLRPTSQPKKKKGNLDTLKCRLGLL